MNTQFRDSAASWLWLPVIAALLLIVLAFEKNEERTTKTHKDADYIQ